MPSQTRTEKFYDRARYTFGGWLQLTYTISTNAAPPPAASKDKMPSVHTELLLALASMLTFVGALTVRSELGTAANKPLSQYFRAV